MRNFSAAIAAGMVCVCAGAQNAPVSAYKPLEAFAPLVLPGAVNEYRSANGVPGPKYWQNRADYEIHASLDTAAHALRGSEVITYTNNSPDVLTSLWVNLEENTYRPDSRAKAFAGGGKRRSGDHSTEGYVLESVGVGAVGAVMAAAKYVVSDTRMQIQLAKPLPAGAKMRVAVKYHYTIPGEWGGRTSWGMAKQGEMYDLAQWYPADVRV